MSVILFHGLTKVLAQCILIHGSILARRQCNIYSLPLATSKAYGKPPPESLKRIESTDAMKQVNRLDRRGYTTLIIADGARCYNPLAKKKLLVRECNHSRGQFSIWRWFRNRGRVRIQTGGIDSFWANLGHSKEWYSPILEIKCKWSCKSDLVAVCSFNSLEMGERHSKFNEQNWTHVATAVKTKKVNVDPHHF